MSTGIGNSIQSTDYNSIRAMVAGIFGVGGQDISNDPPTTDRSFGYGQTLASSAVAQNDVISAQQWLNLRTDMVKARQHQTGLAVQTSDAFDGNSLLVPAPENLIVSKLAEQYAYFAFYLIDKRFDVATNQLSIESLGSKEATLTWKNKISHTVSVRGSASGLGRAENLRFFFNAGGKIRFSSNRTGGAASPKNSSWTNMLCNMGEVVYGPNSAVSSISVSGSNTTGSDPVPNSGCSIVPGGSGPGVESSNGFHQLTTSYQRVYQKFAEAGYYASNNYAIFAKVDSTAAPTEITFLIEWTDADAGTDGHTPTHAYMSDEYVTGTIVSNISQQRPSGPNVSVAPVEIGTIYTNITGT